MNETGDEVASRSALTGMEPFAWSLTDSVSYEVAQDTVAQAVAVLVALIDREEQQPAPRADLLTGWEAKLRDATVVQQSLSAVSVETVAEVRRAYLELCRDLRQQLHG